MLEWFSQGSSSLIGIVVIVVVALIILKFFKTLAKPIITLVIAVAAVLIFFNILDLALLGATGKKLLGLLWSCTCGGTNAISGSDVCIAGILSQIF